MGANPLLGADLLYAPQGLAPRIAGLWAIASPAEAAGMVGTIYPDHAKTAARFIVRVLVRGGAPETLAPEVNVFRQDFQSLHRVR